MQNTKQKMNKQQEKKISRFLSLVLRHQPEKIGIELDDAGWVEVDVLLEAMAASGPGITREQLDQVVTNNDKQRFSFSDDGTQIRAKQGHSIEVELGYQPAEPPERLIHGTPSKFVELIREGGLNKMSRHHVHLHENIDVANQVGSRRGKPVLLIVRSAEMQAAGHEFFVTENRVWLTDHVPPEFIEFPE